MKEKKISNTEIERKNGKKVMRKNVRTGTLYLLVANGKMWARITKKNPCVYNAFLAQWNEMAH